MDEPAELFPLFKWAFKVSFFPPRIIYFAIFSLDLQKVNTKDKTNLNLKWSLLYFIAPVKAYVQRQISLSTGPTPCFCILIC